MSDFTIKQGDTLPPLTAVLRDAAGNVVDLTGCAVRFIAGSQGREPILDKAALVADAEGGIVEVPWAIGDTETAGTYEAEIEVTFGNGDVLTFPNTTRLTFQVARELG
jgi:hypothetical protein